MLFIVIEHFQPRQATTVYRRFRDRGWMAPDGVKYFSSWVDFELQRCFQIMEAGSKSMLKDWTDNRSNLVEFEIVPVRTSEETAQVIAPQL